LPVEERQLVMDYRLIYNRLADYYIEQNDFKKAESILDESIKNYPNDMAYFSFDVSSIIESYYKINSFEKGKAITFQLLENIKNGFDNYSFLDEEERKAKYDKTKKYLHSINEHYEID
jgi:tetratricopeptide (TPR) repeat protein